MVETPDRQTQKRFKHESYVKHEVKQGESSKIFQNRNHSRVLYEIRYHRQSWLLLGRFEMFIRPSDPDKKIFRIGFDKR